MTVIDRPTATPTIPPRPAPPAIIEPTRHRWSADEYMKLGDRDVIPHRTELINGEIYDVASQNNPHVAGISNATRLLIAAFDETYWVTIQSTVRLPLGDVPDPDLAVRPGPVSADDNVRPTPLLVIEVSDTTLLFDQVVKGSMYAANGVADYWVLNVKARQLEVYRGPVKDESRTHGWRYAEPIIVKPPGYAIPLAKQDVRFEVAKMLP